MVRTGRDTRTQMVFYLLRAILMFLLAVTVLRLVRSVRGIRRSVPPPRRPSTPEIDPRDIVDTTCRPVDRPAGRG